LSVNDTREIDTGECHLTGPSLGQCSPLDCRSVRLMPHSSFPLCGHRLNNPKVVVDSACVVKPLDICSRGSRTLWKTLEVTDTHYLASQQGLFKAKAYLAVILEAKSTERSSAASAWSSRDRDSHRTNFKKGTRLFLAINGEVSAVKN
jgi:hypothetical protein